MDVIVVGFNYGTVLGAVKSLGKAAYEVGVIILSPVGFKVIRKSKYCSAVRQASFCYEDIYKALEELRGEQEKVLIVPANDTVCMMLDEHAEQLREHYYFPNIEHTPGRLTAFMNKYCQKLLAAECGLATAKGKEYNTDEAGFRSAIAECPYPCFVKASVSASTAGSKDVLGVCRNQEDLEEKFLLTRERGGRSLVIEEYLPVDKELSLYGVSLRDTVVIPAYVSCIEAAAGDSVGIIAEGEVHPAEELGDMLPALERFVRLSRLEGLFCIDLLCSNGNIYFSEMNLRCGASVYAVSEAGSNLPGMLADSYFRVGADTEKPVKTIRFVNEKELLAGWRVGHISSVAFLKALADPVRYLRDREDPGPWRRFCFLLFRGAAAKLIKHGS